MATSNSRPRIPLRTGLARATPLLLLVFAGCATDGGMHPPSHLTPEHYAKNAEVSSPTGQGPVQVNTEKGYEEPYADPLHYRGLYLIASVDRKTGKTAFAVDFMQMIKTPRTKVTVFYDAPEGLMRQTIYVRNGARRCKDQECMVLESVSIPLKESLVRYYADRYSPNLDTHWHFRIDPDFTGEIPFAEMAGLLKRVEETRKSRASGGPSDPPAAP
jgi:hypothetical protein